MSWDLDVDAGGLRASAKAADTIAADLQPSLKKAIDDVASAAIAFKAWTVGPRMAGTGEGWGAAIDTLRDNLAQHAEGLRMLADGHDILEQDVIACFRGW